jgi:ribosomal protein L34E
MPILLNCNNKGCGKSNEHVLDPLDNQVYCADCGNVINGISHFTKTQLKALKQIKKPIKSAYAVRCPKCKNEQLPKLDAKNNLVCPSCNQPSTNVSKPFELLIREEIKKGRQDI